MPVEIFTLGGWDIQVEGKSVLFCGRRSQKCMELLKYFLCNNGRRLSPESIVDEFWSDSNLVDALNTLHTQIFRLRRLLQTAGLYDGAESSPFRLSFENGYYIFSIGKNCSVDTDRFEQFIKEAESQVQEDPGLAIESYKKAIQLYKGEYLPENTDSVWTFSARVRFRRLYVQSLLRQFGLLKKQGRYPEIVTGFEQAMDSVPLEESLNLCYLEALLEMKEYGMALSHYRYVTGRMERELSTKPSAAMKAVYLRITAGEQNFRKAELWDLSRRFSENDDGAGAMYCDLDYFRTIWSLEKRRSKRLGCRTFLGLATISETAGISEESMDAAAQQLKKLLQRCLREGDVLAQWNQRQVLFLLTDAEPEGVIPVGARIRRVLKGTPGCSNLKLELEFQPIQETSVRAFNKAYK